ncbi:MAG: Fe(3+) ABC transporter substrate-binding protein [Hyphomicrobiales bacterium]|nr:Fe(3+) ABC transporter substrate-binding protein [Hyphomicrobiales bacterium]MCP5373623.1 Fe(3+) ABC transporter substrate-binding protein [Hyphomicrobiales bacterium]
MTTFHPIASAGPANAALRGTLGSPGAVARRARRARRGLARRGLAWRGLARLLPAAVLAATALAPLLAPAPARAAEEVNLYSYRQPFLIQPLLDAFTAETGIKVNIVYAQKGMLEKLKAEGMNSPADAVLTVDIGRLTDLVDADLVQPVQSKVLEANIPAHYRHPDGKWFGLSARARIFWASRDRVKPGEVASYDDLAKPAMKGRLCLRSGKHAYNVSLIAARIAHNGIDATRDWLVKVRDNLARKPQGNDRAQAKAIYEGVCDLGVANTYYTGKMATNEKKTEQQDWAKAVRVVFPDQDGVGTHVNVSGAAVTRAAKHRDNAVRLLEFLSGDAAQKLYAERNFEYPVKSGVALHPLVASWGAFKADTISLAEVAKHRAAASRLVDEVKFNDGPGS